MTIAIWRRRSAPRPCRLASRLALPALLIAALAAPAQGAAPAARLAGFRPNADYVLVIDGKPAPAEIDQNDHIPAFLIVAPALGKAVVVEPATQAVAVAALSAVVRQKDGTVELSSGSVLAGLGKFTHADDVVGFQVDGHRVELRPRPPLLGARRGDELKLFNPAKFRDGAAVYSPDERVVAELRKGAAPVTVRVFFGSWCPHCQRLVPPLLRLEDELKGSRVRFEYFGLPPGPALVADLEAKHFAVNRVPTAIVYVNGKEAGRLVGTTAWIEPETSLRDIVNSAAHPR
jgi:thiol-disulfide isomerase/thioredoxin